MNTFYDRQVSANQHQRLGVGAELGWDYLRLSANGYYRLSDWMSSSRYRDYDERVANGFDLRATGYLPRIRSLGRTSSTNNTMVSTSGFSVTMRTIVRKILTP